MVRPDRVPVADALGVMPHPIAIDQPAPSRLGDGQHAAVNMVWHTLHHEAGRLAQALWPVLTYKVIVAADSARSDDDRTGPQYRTRR